MSRCLLQCVAHWCAYVWGMAISDNHAFWQVHEIIRTCHSTLVTKAKVEMETSKLLAKGHILGSVKLWLYFWLFDMLVHKDTCNRQ